MLGLIGLAAGMSGGYRESQQRSRDQARQDKQDAWQTEQQDQQRQEMESRRQLRLGLADAAAPLKTTEVVDIDSVNPGAPRKTSYSLSDGRTVGTREEADAAAATYNAPEAQTARLAQVYMRSGAPEKGLGLSNSITDRQRADQKWEWEKQDRQNAIVREAGVHVAKALLTGDRDAVFSAYNAQGDLKLKEPPTVTRGPAINIPGYEHVPNYIYTGTIVGPDGKERQVRISSHDANMALMQYPDIVKQYSQGAKDAVDAEYKLGMLGAAQTQAKAAVIRANGAASSVGKAPSGYTFQSDGTLKAIPGGPADKSTSPGKPLPISAANGVLTNQQNLRLAQKALALVSGETVDGAAGDTSATGKKGWLPNQVLNRLDPAGVDTRAAIADLGSLVIHDRSGAAVTASEFPRLAPFIPTEKDDAATVKKKLTMFTKNYQAVVDDATEFYRESGYNVPIDKLKTGTGDKPAKPDQPHKSATAPPRVLTPAEAMKLPPGTVFVDANGVTRRRP